MFEQEIIEIISTKPILEEPPQKQFEVKYLTTREIDIPFE